MHTASPFDVYRTNQYIFRYEISTEFNYINQLRAMKKGREETFFQRQILDSCQRLRQFRIYPQTQDNFPVFLPLAMILEIQTDL